MSEDPKNCTECLEKVPPGAARTALLDLLLLADESEQQVRSYMQKGELFAWRLNEGEDAVGIVLVVPVNGEDSNDVELRAVAVREELQGRGIGRQMLTAVLGVLSQEGRRRVFVGTANAGIRQLAYYQKAGFRFHHIERDFFSPARGYPANMREDGIPLRDMVWMDLDLQTWRVGR